MGSDLSAENLMVSPDSHLENISSNIGSRDKFLPFHIPDIGDEEINAVIETLKSGWLTTGPKVHQFEKEFSEFIGVRHAIAVNSGTAALHLALAAIGVTEGDEIIVPTMTFGATAEVVCHLKAKPIFVDCNKKTMNIDLDGVQKAITSKTKAIIPVHMGGHPCEMDKLSAISSAASIKVIEDAAHAFPARHMGVMIGNISDISCFSFYATKTLTTGEGGMVTTNDDKWANQILAMSQHGINKGAWNRYASQGSWYYEIATLGYKYNLSDMAAAIGIQQLKKTSLFLKVRERIAGLYTRSFSDLPEIKTPVCSSDINHAWHLYVIQLELERLTITRNEFIDLLKEKNIGTSVHFIPLHLHPFYRDTFGYSSENFPNATRTYERIISLPIYSKMKDDDIHYVIEVVRSIIQRCKK